MKTKSKNINIKSKRRNGIALLLSLMVLVALSCLVYKLVSDISALKHRQEYMIDYQKTRYACDSAIKYVQTFLPEISLKLPEREDYPALRDFSDTFWMDEETYEDLLLQWETFRQAKEEAEEESYQSYSESSPPADSNSFDISELMAGLMGSQPEIQDEEEDYLKDAYIPGPYNYEWPNVIEPIEFELDGVKVTISIEDENAKMPLIWATHEGSEEQKRASAISIQTFCGWMGMEEDQTELLLKETDKIAKYKKFRLVYPTVSVTQTVKTTASSSSTSSARRTTPVTRTVKKQVQRDPELHARDFAQLILSNSLDLEVLSENMYDMGDRYEPPMKYLGIWGANKININTAPRHVLEAAFTFGGRAEEIADEIIRLRREKKFTKIEDLKERMYGFNDSIQKAQSYITYESEYLSIKITATSGKAKSVMIEGVKKNGKDVKKIASFVY